jgi:hypothetical protein
MFGLGLYIYAGEDIPSIDDSEEVDAANIKSWVDAIKSKQTTIDHPDLPIKYKEQVRSLL